MSDRKHGGLGVDHRAIRKDNAGQRSIFSTEGFYAAFKTDFSAELYDFSRICFTTLDRTSVPICGFAS